MRIFFTFLIAFLQCSAMANTEQEWRWFLGAFCSPKLEAKLCVRSGLAKVRIDKGSHVSAALMDSQMPETNFIFEGHLDKQKRIAGWLTGMAMHEPDKEKYQGAYRSLQMGTACKVEQILLLPAVPDGSVLSLSRVNGLCQ